MFEELFNRPIKEFYEHIRKEGNYRILFSGRFGKGKTTFLNYFFENQNELGLQQKYFTVFLRPINYSVAGNDDIFKYIKYDIVLELLKKDIQFEENDFSFIETLPLFIQKHPEKIMGNILSAIPMLGKAFNDYFEKTIKLHEEIKSHNATINKHGIGNNIEAFLESIENSNSSIYEHDIITKIIEKAIEKRNQLGEQVVLVIDDLDRLDPDHIFRILNVFASHFDISQNKYQENKFGFNKVILVCDLNNLRNIYKNRYGANVDFIGYIDKFYSSEPYYFINYDDLKDVLKKLLVKNKVKCFGNNKNLFTYLSEVKCSIGIEKVLQSLLFYDFISFRSILQCLDNQTFDIDHTFTLGKSDFDNQRYAVLIETKILNDIIGGYEKTIHILDSLAKIDKKLINYENHVRQILFLFSQKADYEIVRNTGSGKQIELAGKKVLFNIGNFTVEDLRIDAGNGVFPNFKPSVIYYYECLKLLLENFFSYGYLE